MNKRIDWVDAAKYICIICVIMVHLDSNTRLLSAFYDSFFLMGFLFVSGYCYKNRNGFAVTIRRKIKQLFIPWLVWGGISLCFHQLFSGWRKNAQIMGFGDELKWFLLQVRGINDGPWFIAMLFVSFIPFYFLIKAYEASDHKNRFRCCTFVLYVLGIVYSQYMPPLPYGTNARPWHIEYLPNALFFMFLGYEYRNRYEKKLENIENSFFPIAAVLYAAICCAAYFCSFRGAFRVLFTTVYQIAGVVFLILVSKRIRMNRYFRFVGQNTLTYFPMHVYVYTIGEPLFRKVIPGLYSQILNNVLFSSCFAVVFALMISAVLIIPAKIVNRYFPFMAGK